DPVDPAAARDGRLPGRAGIVADGRDGPESGDGYALHPRKVTKEQVWVNNSTIPSKGQVLALQNYLEVVHGGGHTCTRAASTPAGVLSFDPLGSLPARRGLPRAGSAAPA